MLQFDILDQSLVRDGLKLKFEVTVAIGRGRQVEVILKEHHKFLKSQILISFFLGEQRKRVTVRKLFHISIESIIGNVTLIILIQDLEDCLKFC